MPINWKPFVELVRSKHSFLLTTHIRPDPDGLGSQLGLAEVLRQMGKEVHLVISGTWPPRYSFLDPQREIRGFQMPGDEYRRVDAIMVLDTGTWNQLGDVGPFLKTMEAARVVIDHHLSQDDLGALRFVDATAEATGRLIYEAAQALGQPLSQRAADVLFAALATDTGWFRHKNTTAATFALAETLVQAGARPTYLYDEIYERNSLPRLKLMGLVLQRLRTEENGLIGVTEVRRGDYELTGSLPSDTEDLVNFTRSVDGVEVGLFFMEQPGGDVKVSFRSRTGSTWPRLPRASRAADTSGRGRRLAELPCRSGSPRPGGGPQGIAGMSAEPEA